MFPFNLALGKIKVILMGIVAALLPILYILGRRDGSKIEKTAALEEALETENERADFYKAMEQSTNEIESSTPRNRTELTKRLREHGL